MSPFFNLPKLLSWALIIMAIRPSLSHLDDSPVGVPPQEQPSPQVNLSDELAALNALISTSSWSTLLELTALGIEYQKKVKRPQNLCLHYYSAIASYHLGRVSKSIEDFTTATELCSSASNIGDIYGGLAEALLVSHKVSQSITAYKRAIKNTSDESRRTMYAVKMEKAKSWIADYSPVNYDLTSTSLICLNDFSEPSYNLLTYSQKKEISDKSHKTINENYLSLTPKSFPPRTSPILRIGLISSDFRVHPISTLLRGLIQHLSNSRDDVELYVFSVNDIKTIQGVDDGWWLRNITGTVGSKFIDLKNLSEDQIVTTISNINLTALIDLNGQTLGNLLPLFTHRLSPLQITYLGLPLTTGLTFIDYFVGDKEVFGVDWGGDFFEERLGVGGGGYVINDYWNLQGHVGIRYPFR